MARADCPICQGSGWKVVERTAEGAQALSVDKPGPSIGEPKMVWAVPCDCTAGDRTDRVLAKARVPERYRHCDFENYDADLQYDNPSAPEVIAWTRSLEKAKVTVQMFATEFPIGSECGLLLMGPCGIGKTHLAVAALKRIVQRGHSGLFYDYQDLLKEIQGSYSAESQSTEISVLEPVLKAEILVLDDLGSSKPSLWAIEMVGHILNTRYNAKRVTIITTNYLDPEFMADSEPEVRTRTIGEGRRGGVSDSSRSTSVVRLPSGELIGVSKKEDALHERIGKRMRSRLYEMCRTVHVSAPDYRKLARDAGFR
jgi:DNA replication protein DnaC